MESPIINKMESQHHFFDSKIQTLGNPKSTKHESTHKKENENTQKDSINNINIANSQDLNTASPLQIRNSKDKKAQNFILSPNLKQQEIYNESALSSFHIHNKNNNSKQRFSKLPNENISEKIENLENEFGNEKSPFNSENYSEDYSKLESITRKNSDSNIKNLINQASKKNLSNANSTLINYNSNNNNDIEDAKTNEFYSNLNQHQKIIKNRLFNKNKLNDNKLINPQNQKGLKRVGINEETNEHIDENFQENFIVKESDDFNRISLINIRNSNNTNYNKNNNFNSNDDENTNLNTNNIFGFNKGDNSSSTGFYQSNSNNFYGTNNHWNSGSRFETSPEKAIFISNNSNNNHYNNHNNNKNITNSNNFHPDKNYQKNSSSENFNVSNNEKSHNFKFSERGFNSKGSLSLSESKNNLEKIDTIENFNYEKNINHGENQKIKDINNEPLFNIATFNSNSYNNQINNESNLNQSNTNTNIIFKNPAFRDYDYVTNFNGYFNNGEKNNENYDYYQNNFIENVNSNNHTNILNNQSSVNFTPLKINRNLNNNKNISSKNLNYYYDNNNNYKSTSIKSSPIRLNKMLINNNDKIIGGNTNFNFQHSNYMNMTPLANNMSNINVNNSNMNEVVKRDLLEYIRYLEKNNILIIKENENNLLTIEFMDSDINSKKHSKLNLLELDNEKTNKQFNKSKIITIYDGENIVHNKNSFSDNFYKPNIRNNFYWKNKDNNESIKINQNIYPNYSGNVNYKIPLSTRNHSAQKRSNSSNKKNQKVDNVKTTSLNYNKEKNKGHVRSNRKVNFLTISTNNKYNQNSPVRLFSHPRSNSTKPPKKIGFDNNQMKGIENKNSQNNNYNALGKSSNAENFKIIDNLDTNDFEEKYQSDKNLRLVNYQNLGYNYPSELNHIKNDENLTRSSSINKNKYSIRLKFFFF